VFLQTAGTGSLPVQKIPTEVWFKTRVMAPAERILQVSSHDLIVLSGILIALVVAGFFQTIRKSRRAHFSMYM
jgi:hypothetical protein